MTVFVYILAVIGALVTFCTIVLPIIKAIIYGHMVLVFEMITIDWPNRYPWGKFVWRFITSPWTTAWGRLFGRDMYTASMTKSGWKYTPLFKITRVENWPKEEDEESEEDSLK